MSENMTQTSVFIVWSYWWYTGLPHLEFNTSGARFTDDHKIIVRHLVNSQNILRPILRQNLTITFKISYDNVMTHITIIMLPLTSVTTLVVHKKYKIENLLFINNTCDTSIIT